MRSRSLRVSRGHDGHDGERSVPKGRFVRIARLGRMAAGALEHVQKHRIQKEQSALVELIPANVKGSIDVEEIQVTGMPLARVIVAKARELAIDVIVIPAQKQKGWMRFFKPNILQQVMQAAPCSVFAVCPPQSLNDPPKP